VNYHSGVCARGCSGFIGVLTVVLGVLCATQAFAMPATNPDALWEIVGGCIAGRHADYCACPAFARSCCDDPHRLDRDVVWARNAAFVAIQDMKACGCAASFVAGLALPRTRVSGIEDPRRPEGIWPFAWQVAKARIRNEREIALVMNPKTMRTQQQMHVHILRLQPGERARLDALPAGVETDGAVVLPLASLQAVFAVAIAAVGVDHFGDHGILVARAPTNGFRAVITDRTSPQRFTLNDCH
jgi:CDP-diacylglycerol pyrophosphatase